VVKVTEPVGVGLLLPSVTTTLTDRACVVVRLDEAGVTVTIGVLSVGMVVVVVGEGALLLHPGNRANPQPMRMIKATCIDRERRTVNHSAPRIVMTTTVSDKGHQNNIMGSQPSV
jgi:hypothetical protein